ncbi:MAG TPA: fasciclin domain-containing protein, partial [Gemmatimonadaceae bacterium]
MMKQDAKKSDMKSTKPLRRDAKPDSARAPRPRSSTQASPYADSLLEACAAIPRLQTFSAAVRSAGLTMLLDGTGPITIFAPTDRAFERMPTDQRSAILADPARLAALLRRH